MNVPGDVRGVFDRDRDDRIRIAGGRPAHQALPMQPGGPHAEDRPDRLIGATAKKGRIVYRIHWQRPSERASAATDVVEVADTEDGVLLRINPTGEFAFLISRRAWADFLAAAGAGEYDATLRGHRRTPRTIGRRLKTGSWAARGDSE